LNGFRLPQNPDRLGGFLRREYRARGQTDCAALAALAALAARCPSGKARFTGYARNRQRGFYGHAGVLSIVVPRGGVDDEQQSRRWIWLGVAGEFGITGRARHACTLDSAQAEVAKHEQDDDDGADEPDESIHDACPSHAPEEFRQGRPRSICRHRLTHFSASPADLLFVAEQAGI